MKLIIFAVVSGIIIWYSLSSLRNVRTHGFYRFFAWESVLILVLLNIQYWFSNPFSVLQIFSWLLLVASLFLVAQAAYLLRRVGKPERNFENTTALVRIGAYRYIRHPLYSSLLMLAWGAFLKRASLFSGILALIVTGFLVVMAKVEEVEDLQKFGSDYRAYMKKTKMFIPYLF